jgi:hypothetical protein
MRATKNRAKADRGTVSALEILILGKMAIAKTANEIPASNSCIKLGHGK